MRCSTHGLATGPDGLCVRCRRERDDASGEASVGGPVRRTGRLLGVVLVAAGVLLVAFAVAERLPRRAAPTGSRAPDPAPSAAPARASAPLTPLAPAEVDAAPVARADAKGGSPSRLDRAARDVTIVLYCTPSSPDCPRVRQWMLDRGYAYTEKDVEADPAVAAAAARISPTVPAFSIDGTPIPGFDPERVENAIQYAAARRLQR